MEYQKNGNNYSFGFGRLTVAGTGNIAGAKKIRHTRKAVVKGALKTGAKASLITALMLVLRKKH